MTVRDFESSARSEECLRILKNELDGEGWRNLALLPIPSSKDKIHLSGTDIPFSELVKEYGEGDLIVGYGIPESAKTELVEKNCIVCDCAMDEIFLKENAVITAECTLGILLSGCNRAPRDLRIGIVGYGRIGKALTQMLLSHGAFITVFTGSEEKLLKLCEYGIHAVRYGTDASLSELDILINTAPDSIFSEEELQKPNRIIELASGDNLPPLSTVERYPSIPSRMFPISAGREWARSVLRAIS